LFSVKTMLFLPIELIQTIFSYLPVVDLLTMSLVCSRFEKILRITPSNCQINISKMLHSNTTIPLLRTYRNAIIQHQPADINQRYHEHPQLSTLHNTLTSLAIFTNYCPFTISMMRFICECVKLRKLTLKEVCPYYTSAPTHPIYILYSAIDDLTIDIATDTSINILRNIVSCHRLCIVNVGRGATPDDIVAFIHCQRHLKSLSLHYTPFAQHIVDNINIHLEYMCVRCTIVTSPLLNVKTLYIYAYFGAPFVSVANIPHNTNQLIIQARHIDWRNLTYDDNMVSILKLKITDMQHIENMSQLFRNLRHLHLYYEDPHWPSLKGTPLQWLRTLILDTQLETIRVHHTDICEFQRLSTESHYSRPQCTRRLYSFVVCVDGSLSRRTNITNMQHIVDSTTALITSNIECAQLKICISRR
jgi:hypothetical protein